MPFPFVLPAKGNASPGKWCAASAPNPNRAKPVPPGAEVRVPAGDLLCKERTSSGFDTEQEHRSLIRNKQGLSRKDRTSPGQIRDKRFAPQTPAVMRLIYNSPMIIGVPVLLGFYL